MLAQMCREWSVPLRTIVSCRKISISLIDPVSGEWRAQACAACSRKQSTVATLVAAMKVLAAMLLGFWPTLLAAQSQPLQSFTSADRVFQFKYSGLLVRCIESKTQPGLWLPDDSCEAYFPVCDDAGSQGSITAVCFAYPKSRFKESPTFEAGTFSVAEVKKINTEKECLVGSPDWVVDPHGNGKTESINGVKFKVFQLSDAGMNQSLVAHVYRTVHKNRCYELSIRMAMASSGAFDPGTIKEFTKKDWNEVDGHLRESLKSFRFLNSLRLPFAFPCQ